MRNNPGERGRLLHRLKGRHSKPWGNAPKFGLHANRTALKGRERRVVDVFPRAAFVDRRIISPLLALEFEIDDLEIDGFFAESYQFLPAMRNAMPRRMSPGPARRTI